MAQKSLIAIIAQTAGELNLPQPTVVISSQDQNAQKLLSLLRAVCDDLLVEFDWQVLQTRYTFTTVNGQESYTLPTDIERYLNGTFYDQNNRWPLRGPKTPSEWEFMKVGLFSGAPFSSFRIYGGKFWVTPVPGTTPYTFVMEYISNNYARDSSTTFAKPDFTADSDICVFDHRVLVYGLKLKWMASIAQDTSYAEGDYNRALEFAKGSDVPAQRLSLIPLSAYPMLSTANYPDGSWTL